MFVAAYPVAIRLTSPDGDFHTTVYKCTDITCSTLTSQIADVYGNPNQYQIPEQDPGMINHAQYTYKG